VGRWWMSSSLHLHDRPSPGLLPCRRCPLGVGTRGLGGGWAPCCRRLRFFCTSCLGGRRQSLAARGRGGALRCRCLVPDLARDDHGAGSEHRRRRSGRAKRVAWRRGAAAADGSAALRRVGKGVRCCISLEDGGTRVRPTVSCGDGPREPQRRRWVTIIVSCRSTTCSSPFGAWSPCPIVIPAAQLLDVGPQPIAHRRRRVRPQRPSALQGLGRGWAPRLPSSRLLGRWWPSLLTVLRSGEAVVLLRSAMAFVCGRPASACSYIIFFLV
jgi:hypothetical protein